MSGSATPETGEILGMSDEDFLNLNAPPQEGQADPEGDPDAGVADTPPLEADSGDQSPVEPAPQEEGADQEDPAPEAEPVLPQVPEESADLENKEDVTPLGSEAKPDDGAKKDAETPDSEAPEASAIPKAESFQPPSNEDAQAFFMKIMTPFKANGKTIALRTPEEAIQLMQMGANYTKKLQQLQPHRKMLMMLENHNLLDEGKLSFLIDLERKDPEAIKKLIKDSGIDPLEIDTSAESTYSGGNHQVTDTEANFRLALDDLTNQTNGRETLVEIESNWDQASKDVLWKSPELLAIFHSQRENGIYSQIVEEVERQRLLGQIPPNTPFLQAYKTVGDTMFATKEQEVPAAPIAPEPAAPAPVAVRTAAPKSPVANGDKASAASPTRSTPRKTEKLVNPLAMSDDEFLKTMQDRL